MKCWTNLLILSVGCCAVFVQLTAAQQTATNVTTTRRPRPTYNTSDDALREISARLYSLDENGAHGRLQLDTQVRVVSANNRTDLAPKPLFKAGIPADLVNKPTYKTLLALFDNYLPAVNETETVTKQELDEEVAFLNALMATRVMASAHRFLVSQGLANSSVDRFKEYLRTIWFGLYQRAPGKKGSSGFEHVFLGEWKNGISGLHSWIRYQREEARGAMNYLGYSRILPIGQTVVGLIDLPMEWQGIYKPVSTMVMATSPELDIALYTICFLARPDAQCPVQGPNPPPTASVRASGSSPGLFSSRGPRATRYRIQTHSQLFQGQKYIGSAYPIF